MTPLAAQAVQVLTGLGRLAGEAGHAAPGPAGTGWPAWVTWLLALNAAGLLASSAFGVAAVRRPGALSGATGEPGRGQVYYAQMYAARAVPLGLVGTGVLLGAPAQSVPWLVLAGTVQVLDAWAGRGAGRRAAVLAPGAAAATHLGSALLLGLWT